MDNKHQNQIVIEKIVRKSDSFNYCDNDSIVLLQTALQNMITKETKQSMKRNEESSKIRNNIELINNNVGKLLNNYNVVKEKLANSELENKRLKDLINKSKNSTKDDNEENKNEREKFDDQQKEEEREDNINNVLNWINEYENDSSIFNDIDIQKSIVDNQIYHKRYDSHILKLRNELAKIESSIDSKTYASNDELNHGTTNNLFDYDFNYDYDHLRHYKSTNSKHKRQNNRHKHHNSKHKHQSSRNKIEKPHKNSRNIFTKDDGGDDDDDDDKDTIKKKKKTRRKRSFKKLMKEKNSNFKELNDSKHELNEEDIALQVQLHSVACVPPPIDNNSNNRKPKSVIYHELIDDSYELSLCQRFTLLRSSNKFKCEQALKIYKPLVLSPPSVISEPPYLSFCFFIGSPSVVLSAVRYGFNMKKVTDERLILYRSLVKKQVDLKSQRVLLVCLQPGGTEILYHTLSEFLAAKNSKFSNGILEQLWNDIESGELTKRGIRKLYFTKGNGLSNTQNGCWLLLQPKDAVPCYILSLKNNNKLIL